MNPATPEPDPHLISLGETELALWRETLSHLRHLSEEVWTGMKLFLVCDGFILLSITLLLAVARGDRLVAGLVGLLSLSGILLTLVGRYILKRHRVYYLQMLAKKSLLEEDLGFYRAKFQGSNVDLAFPWRLTPEVVAEIRRDLEAWVQKSVRGPGTIARFQFLTYEVVILLYVLVFLIVLLSAFN